MRQRVLCFDLMRCVAAIAVIAIHVLAPYRHELHAIPFDQWLTAITINGLSRWAVPVFILISGALMLSDTRPFDLGYYVKRRLGKVFIPFVVWSLFYAMLAGWSAQGYDSQVTAEVLGSSLTHATYYHLGFFYYFIPLYFVIPLFQWGLRHYGESFLVSYVGLWGLTSLLFLLRIDGPWSNQLWLFSGYLPLGYLLLNRFNLSARNTAVVGTLGVASLLLTVTMVVYLSLTHGEYTFERWLSYKTLNVVLAASMVFVVCRYAGESLSPNLQRMVSLISRYSLGIYILHPIFLWPMNEYGWYQGHPLWVIPVWVVLSSAGALGVSWCMARSRWTRWLLP
ncbi:acyltransferase [Vibrio sp. WXL210]|uniref:acyltransferase n=1 Tax=Vibrio sp. WXL210 TaxID=3450709 RepID=UPI003EC4D7DE